MLYGLKFESKEVKTAINISIVILVRHKDGPVRDIIKNK